MATTAGTTLPMQPVGGRGSATVPIMHFPSNASGIAAGDIVILTAGKLVVDNDAPVANTILGVALGKSTAADQSIPVALAVPGALFECNLIDGATDETGVYAEDIAGTLWGIEESADGNACLDISDTGVTTACLVALRYARQKNTTQDVDPVTAGVGKTNPRVVVAFVVSKFNQNFDHVA